MMELELGWQEKVRLGQEVDQQETYIYLLMLILTTFLKDQMRIYFLNFLFPWLMQL